METVSIVVAIGILLGPLFLLLFSAVKFLKQRKSEKKKRKGKQKSAAKSKGKQKTVKQNKAWKRAPSPPNTSYYRARLLTNNEERNWQALSDAAHTFHLYLFAKVRLIDIVQTIDPKDASAINKVIRKHVDFLLCDQNFVPVCVIEIDDPSHNTASAQHRDAVKNQALSDAGVPILRTMAINSGALDRYLKHILASHKKGTDSSYGTGTEAV